jgi:membrane-associated phospholipid phosphatase
VSDEHQFFGPAVAAFDAAVDQALDRIRGNPIADRVFLTASALGDWSLGWHLLGATMALLDERRLPDALRLSATLGVESVVVNQGVKRLFHRHRPAYVPSSRTKGWPVIRIPITSSFPSGHASAAACAVVLLGKRQPRLVPLWLGLAAVVSLSRCYVRMHHASDVVVGAAIGAAIGEIASLLVPLPET